MLNLFSIDALSHNYYYSLSLSLSLTQTHTHTHPSHVLLIRPAFASIYEIAIEKNKNVKVFVDF